MVKNLDGRSQYIIHIYNSFTFIGRVAFDNKYKILTLNCGSLSIVFAKASEVIMVHGYIYISEHIIHAVGGPQDEYKRQHVKSGF